MRVESATLTVFESGAGGGFTSGAGRPPVRGHRTSAVEGSRTQSWADYILMFKMGKSLYGARQTSELEANHH